MTDTSIMLQAQAALSATRGKPPTLPPGADISKIREKAEEFEGFFLAQMMQPMFDALETDGPFGGGFGEKVWRSLQVEEFGKAVAANGGVGIADTLVQEFLRMQEQPEGSMP